MSSRRTTIAPSLARQQYRKETNKSEKRPAYVERDLQKRLVNVVMKKGIRAYFSKTTILKRDLLMWKKTCICKRRPIKETHEPRDEDGE